MGESNGRATAEQLAARRLPEDDVEVDGVGTVRVRGLSRVEAMIVQKINDPETRERKILALGMVDPPMTEAQAGAWMAAAAAGEIEPVTLEIARLSGTLDDSAKEAYKRVRSGRGARV